MIKTIFRTILTFTFLLLPFTLSHANNLLIENVSIVSKDKANKTSTVAFDISWDDSWRGSINHDAVWVFVKYKLNSDGNWYHANLKTSGTNPTDVDRGTGTEIDVIVPTDKIGAFIERSNTGAGTTAVEDVELVWDWDASGLDADAVIEEIKVFGIEMTYIPEGSFYVGDTESDYGQFEAGATGAVFQVTGEGSLTLGGGGGGSLGNNNATGMASADDFNDTTTQTLPAAYPKGYDGFYCMKYEISQGQYRDFLNTLTSTQKATRTATLVSTKYVMSTTDTVSYRNGLYTADGSTIVCDYDDNATGDEATDGQWIAMNYISWMDGCAYGDWAGLRPMTELEFEKVCRGPESPVADEYAWGSTDLTQAEGAVQNPGENTEVANTTGNGLANYNGAGTDISGPLRVGFAAVSATSRVSSGSGYYGNMNLSDNLWERAVTVGNSTGRLFTGTNGDGILTDNGNGNNSDWPGYVTTEITGATGSGFRGGIWSVDAEYMQVSNRGNATITVTGRFISFGFRLVRQG